MTKAPYAVIGGTPFANKTAVRKHYSALINAFPVGHELQGANLAFTADLIKRHRDYEQKAGVGIVRFVIARHKMYGTKKIEFERIDGTVDDFSINFCLDPVTPEQYAAMNFRCAARNAVLPDIRDFKNRSGMVCAITGEKHAREDLHTDHAPPMVFSAIMQSFLGAASKAPTDYEYADDNAGLAVFADLDVAAGFRSFHAERAALRVIHKSINLSGGVWKNA